MIRRAVSFKALTAAACTLLVGVATAAAQLTGTAAPDFVLKSVSGQNLRLSEFRGEVVMLTFGRRGAATAAHSSRTSARCRRVIAMRASSCSP